MCAIYHRRWFRTSINFLLQKSKLLETPSRSSILLLLTSNYIPRVTRSLQRTALARSSRNASEGSVIRFRILNLQANAHVPADAAGQHPASIVGSCSTSSSSSSSIGRPCFSHSYVVSVNERPNFRVVTGMDSSVGAGFMNECNGRETVEGANEKYPGSRVS